MKKKKQAEKRRGGGRRAIKKRRRRSALQDVVATLKLPSVFALLLLLLPIFTAPPPPLDDAAAVPPFLWPQIGHNSANALLALYHAQKRGSKTFFVTLSLYSVCSPTKKGGEKIFLFLVIFLPARRPGVGA